MMQETELLKNSGLFDEAWYLSQNPDVAESGQDPLQHYIQNGAREMRDPSPYFDTCWYLKQNPSIALSGKNPLQHYIDNSVFSDCDPNPFFSNRYYLNTYTDVASANMNPLAHFSLHGYREGRSVSSVHRQLQKELDSQMLTRGGWNRGTAILVGHDASRTGASLILLRLLESLVNEFRLRIVLILARGGVLEADYRKYASVINLQMPPFTSETISRPACRTLFRSLLSLKPQFTLCNTLVTSPILADMKSVGLESICLCHEYADEFPKTNLETIVKNAKRVVFPTSSVFYAAVDRLGYYPANASCKPQGLLDACFNLGHRDEARQRIREKYGLNENTFIVMGCGTICQRKGVDLFVTAARFLSSQNPDFDLAFIWVGATNNEPKSGTPEFWFNFDIEHSGLTDNFILEQSSDITADFYKGSDVFLHLARQDPFPNVIIEAMACGLPVVAYDGNIGLPDSVGKNGFQLPYMDIAAVCEKLRWLYENPVEKESIGLKLSETIKSEHTFSEYVRSLMDLIERDFSLPEELFDNNQTDAKVGAKRIIIPAADWGISGVNSALETLLRFLMAKGWDIEIVFTQPSPSDIEPLAMNLPGVPYTFLEINSGSPVQLWMSLIQYVEEKSPCIVLMAYDFVANSMIPALTNNVGVVMWNQSDDNDYYEQSYRLGRYCNAIVCVSELIKQTLGYLNPLLAEKVSVIYNTNISAHEVVTVKEPPGEELQLIYTGRLVQYQKRIWDYLDLAEALDARGIRFKLTLIGEFCESEGIEEAWKARANSLLKASKIILTGRMARDEIFAHLRKSDLFILLSDFEGFPLSLVEAMAQGCVPLVADISSGIPEIISDDENGMIMRGRDYAEWADNIVELGKDHDRYTSMSANAIKTILDRFTIEKIGTRFEKVLDDVADEICEERYQRPQALHWGSNRCDTGDVLPSPGLLQLPEV